MTVAPCNDDIDAADPPDPPRPPERRDSEATAAARRRHPAAAVFPFDVDDTTFRHDQPRITGGEIMDLAGVPRAQGLVRLHDDGTTSAVAADADVYLVRGLHFRRRPRFKRG